MPHMTHSPRLPAVSSSGSNKEISRIKRDKRFIMDVSLENTSVAKWRIITAILPLSPSFLNEFVVNI